MATHSFESLRKKLEESREGQEALKKAQDELDAELREAGDLPEIALRNETNINLDDVVVNNVTMFHAEFLDDQHLWMACYFKNGERITFSVEAGPRSRVGLGFHAHEFPEMYVDPDDGKVYRASD